jgi:mono/diheme cytochrome c family protein/peroxiredoxin
MSHHGNLEIQRKPARPAAVAAIGAVSLIVFAAAGWSLGRMRTAVPAVPTETVNRTATEPKPIARGRLVYQVHCTRCHGPSGHGDGSDAPLLKTAPRDLATVVGTKSQSDLRRAITEGITGTPMTGFGPLLSPRELDSVLEFVRSLATATVAFRDHPSAAMPASLVENLKLAGFVPDARWRTAPALAVRDVDGKMVSIESLRGSLVLVVFWGTSCGSCVSELPDLEQLAVRYRDAGLRVLPVCLDQTKAAEAHAVAVGHVKNLPVYVDPDGFAKLRYDVQGLPTAVLIDRDGRMLGAANGAKNWADPHVHALVTSCLAGK